MKAPLSLLLLLLVSLAVGCGAPWTVVRASGPPSSLVGTQSVNIEFDYAQAIVDGRMEADFLDDNADVDAEDKLESVKEALESGVLSALAARMPVPTAVAMTNAETRLVIHVESIVRGKYAVIYAKPTRVVALLQWMRGGAVTDEARVEVSVAASVMRPAIVQRARVAGDELGTITARYFETLTR